MWCLHQHQHQEPIAELAKNPNFHPLNVHDFTLVGVDLSAQTNVKWLPLLGPHAIRVGFCELKIIICMFSLYLNIAFYLCGVTICLVKYPRLTHILNLSYLVKNWKQCSIKKIIQLGMSWNTGPRLVSNHGCFGYVACAATIHRPSAELTAPKTLRSNFFLIEWI